MANESLVVSLWRQGYSLRTDGKTLWVSPSSLLSEEQRDEIARQKLVMVAELAGWSLWWHLQAGMDHDTLDLDLQHLDLAFQAMEDAEGPLTQSSFL